MAKKKVVGFWINRIWYLIRTFKLFKVFFTANRSKYNVTPDKILPVVTLQELTDSSKPDMVEVEKANGNVTVEELECIAKIVKHNQPKTIFEIGTFDGRTTMNMAHNAPDSKIYTLDLPAKDIHKTEYRIKTADLRFIKKEVSGARFIGTKYEKQIEQIYADSASFDYSSMENSIDLIFIDGSHAYDYVINDTKIAMKLLRNGKGTIIWHDYGWREVIQALNEFYQGDDRFKNLKNIEGTTIAYLKIDS
jgi:predicted O-methyltransferase YrrM